MNFFSQFQSCPTDERWSYLKRVLRYIKGSLDIGLEYRADSKAPLLEVFADADWDNDPADRRSVSGCLFKVAGCCVGWMTRKQQVVSLSSTEAELNALCAAACFEIWLVRLLKDLGKEAKLPVFFYEDNQSTIRIAEDSKNHGRLKHVDVKYHFLRDLVKDGRIRIRYISTADQVADMMTKGLPATALRRHRSKAGLVSCCD